MYWHANHASMLACGMWEPCMLWLIVCQSGHGLRWSEKAEAISFQSLGSIGLCRFVFTAYTVCNNNVGGFL